MKNLKFLIWCTNVHFLYGETVASDDILAMLQNSLRVNHQGQQLEQPEKEDVGVPDMKSISRLEEIVMARVREGLGGDDKLSDSINASIKQMFTGIIATTAANQAKIIADIKAFALCKTKMWKSYDKAIPMEKTFWILGEIYPKCTKAEELLKVNKMKSDKLYETVKSEVATKKKLAAIVEKDCKNVCENEVYENYNEQLEKLSKYYGDCVKKIKPKIDDVAKATEELKEKTVQKALDDARYKAMKSKCDLIAYRMNGKKCQAVGDLSGSCSFYEACWKKAKQIYEEDKKRIMVEEANMKIEWRALTRIQCYLLVLNTQNDKDKKKEKEQLDKCIAIKKEDISTKHLDIDYKKIPKKPVCPKDAWCPCTKAYLNYYYKTGPKERCGKNIVKDYMCAACPKGMPKKKPKAKAKKENKVVAAAKKIVKKR